MTEDDHITQLKSRWPEREATLELIAAANEAVRAFPQSARLWVIRGDLIQLGPDPSLYPLDEALASYERAIQIDPEFAEAWDEVGYFHDAIRDDEATAQKYFQRAEFLRNNKKSVVP